MKEEERGHSSDRDSAGDVASEDDGQAMRPKYPGAHRPEIMYLTFDVEDPKLAVVTVTPFIIFQTLRHLCLPRKIVLLPQQSAKGGRAQFRALVELGSHAEMQMVCDRLDRTYLELCDKTGTAGSFFVCALPSTQQNKSVTVDTNSGRAMTPFTKLPSVFLPKVGEHSKDPVIRAIGARLPSVISVPEALGPIFPRLALPTFPPLGPYNPAEYHACGPTTRINTPLAYATNHYLDWQEAQESAASADGPATAVTIPDAPEVRYEDLDPLCEPQRAQDLTAAIEAMRRFLRQGNPLPAAVPPDERAVIISGRKLPYLPRPVADEARQRQFRGVQAVKRTRDDDHHEHREYHRAESNNAERQPSHHEGGRPPAVPAWAAEAPRSQPAAPSVNVVVGVPHRDTSAHNVVAATSNGGHVYAGQVRSNSGPHNSQVTQITHVTAQSHHAQSAQAHHHHHHQVPHTQQQHSTAPASYSPAQQLPPPPPHAPPPPARVWERYWDERYERPYFVLRDVQSDTVLHTTWDPKEVTR